MLAEAVLHFSGLIYCSVCDRINGELEEFGTNGELEEFEINGELEEFGRKLSVV